MVSLPSGRAGWVRVRMSILVVALLAGGAAVAHGAWDLGVTRSEELTRMAREQYTRRIKLSARRGLITDRHGEELAVEVEVDSVYADPRKVESPAAAAAVLAPILDKDEAKLASRLASRRHFVWLKRRVGPQVAEKVRAVKLPGIDLVKESKRFYPNRSLAAHVIGFAGMDSKGLEGVERKLDDQLRGNLEAGKGMSDARGHIVFAEGALGSGGLVGNSVELTIDRTIQYIVEQELANIIRVFEAKAGHIVVMEPKSGEVLALANWPTYNPNLINESTPESRRNRAVLDVFEPGSTFKVFTLGAALNAGRLRPDRKIFCERGRMEIYDAVIHDDHRDGWLNPTQCLKRSSNICFAKIAQDLGKERFYHYIRRFGFGERTHIELPLEMRGSLNHFKKWYDIDTATIAFGQGIGVTGLQMATALAAVANGGKLMKPLLVKRVVDPRGETVRNNAPQVRRRVISRYTSRLVADMMTAVTEEGGTGTQGALEGYLVAGKTGTAQKSVGSKGYADDKWVASFFAFVPSNRPRLVISVVVDEPLINHYGGTVAAPSVKRIADQALRYLGVAPNMDVAARERARDKMRSQKERGVGLGVDASAKAVEEAIVSDSGQTVLPADGQVATPDLAGLSMTGAMERLAMDDLRPLFMGSGVAVEQVPQPGEPIDVGEFVQVNFQPLKDEAPRKKDAEDI